MEDHNTSIKDKFAIVTVTILANQSLVDIIANGIDHIRDQIIKEDSEFTFEYVIDEKEPSIEECRIIRML